MATSPTTMTLSMPVLTTSGKVRHIAVSLPRIDALLDDGDLHHYSVPFERKFVQVRSLAQRTSHGAAQTKRLPASVLLGA